MTYFTKYLKCSSFSGTTLVYCFCRHFKNNLAILEIVKSKWLIVILDKIILQSASVENAVLVS